MRAEKDTRQQAPLIIGWGEILWDVFPAGRRLGGAPASFVYHVAGLGDRAMLVSRVGPDEAGQAAVAELASHGLETRAVQRDPHRATGMARVEMEAGEPRYTFSPDAAWDHLELEERVAALLAQTRLFCFGTLAQRTEAARDVLRRAVSTLPHGCVRLCDLNLRPPFDTREAVDSALAAASVVKLGEQEAARVGELFGVSSPVRYLLEERGIQIVALTHGPRGSELVTRDSRHEHPGFQPTPGGDPVGAGDAFTAVLAHHLVHGSALPQICGAANRYAAHVASCAGAMPEVPEALRAAAAGIPRPTTSPTAG